MEDIYGYYSVLDQQGLINATGCILPCTYDKYNLAGNLVELKNNNNSSSTFELNFVSSMIEKQVEILTYDITSLVSEVGGSLGLFLGYSFADIWTFSKWITSVIGRRSNKMQ